MQYLHCKKHSFFMFFFRKNMRLIAVSGLLTFLSDSMGRVDWLLSGCNFLLLQSMLVIKWLMTVC